MEEPTANAALRAVVAIPVRNECERIAACLEALDAQQDLPVGSFGIVLFLNNCSDGTDVVVRSLIGRIACPMRVIQVEDDRATAGWARRAAMDAACEWLRDDGITDGIILTTDADSRVDPTWVCQNLDLIEKGVDAVAGRFRLDPEEAALLPTALHERGRLEGKYEALLTEIDARLDPELFNPWPCHWAASGATLAVRRSFYIRAGGMPALSSGEDRAFIAALRACGARVRHAPEVQVTTSGRLQGRATGGAADTMKLRCEMPDSPCDARLEPLRVAVRRTVWRKKLRRTYGSRNFDRIAACGLKLCLGDVVHVMSTCPGFLPTYEKLSDMSPVLSSRPLRPFELPLQIRLARMLVMALRLQAWWDRTTGLKGDGRGIDIRSSTERLDDIKALYPAE